MAHDQFLKRLVSNIKCGVCGQRYEATNVKVLGHQDDLWFLGVYCSSCRSRGLAAVVVRESSIVEIVTDLTEAEMARLQQAEAVNIDDLLDIHNFLKHFDGDFARFFSKVKSKGGDQPS